MVHTRPQTDEDKAVWADVREEARCSSSSSRLPCLAFYGEYHGHLIKHLDLLLPALRNSSSGRDRIVVWLCGDSTLDNKYWLPSTQLQPAINGYERVLHPPKMAPDVAYWVNRELQERGLSAACVNCAVEESTLGGRMHEGLTLQDGFLAQHVRPTDVVVVSAGGNDIALRPTLWTVLSMATLIMMPRVLIEAGVAPGLGHFVRLFRGHTERYVREILSGSAAGEKPGAATAAGRAARRPRAVVACMLYFLDEASTPSWASFTLRKLGYDSDPSKLQLIIRKIYELATCKVKLDGVTVVPLPFFETLDGKQPLDYVQRVEPSAQGGQKMARALLERIEGLLADP